MTKVHYSCWTSRQKTLPLQVEFSFGITFKRANMVVLRRHKKADLSDRLKCLIYSGIMVGTE